jgi:hypothetical protein
MDKEKLKAELKAASEKAIEELVSEVEEEEDFAELEQKLIKHMEKQGKETIELVAKHKVFSP